MKVNVGKEIAAMEQMALGQLRDRYAEVFGELPLHRQCQNRLPHLRRRDVVGLVKEESQIRRRRCFGKACQRRSHEHGLPRLPFLLLGFELVAQGHQLVDLRHDAFLLGEGGKGNCKAPSDCPLTFGCPLGGAIDSVLNTKLRTRRLADLFDPVFAQYQTRALCRLCGHELHIDSLRISQSQVLHGSLMSPTWQQAVNRIQKHRKQQEPSP